MIFNELLRGPDNSKFDILPKSKFWALFGQSLFWDYTIDDHDIICTSFSANTYQIISLVSIKRNNVKKCLKGGPKTKKCLLQKQLLAISYTYFMPNHLTGDK